MDASTTTSALSTFITNAGTVITAAGGWVGDVVNVILTTPPLLVTFCVGLAFSGVKLFKALR